MGRRKHVNIHKYQYEWVEEEPVNLSKLVRQAIDDRMIEIGADPERWEETYGK